MVDFKFSGYDSKCNDFVDSVAALLYPVKMEACFINYSIEFLTVGTRDLHRFWNFIRFQPFLQHSYFFNIIGIINGVELESCVKH